MYAELPETSVRRELTSPPVQDSADEICKASCRKIFPIFSGVFDLICCINALKFVINFFIIIVWNVKICLSIFFVNHVLCIMFLGEKHGSER